MKTLIHANNLKKYFPIDQGFFKKSNLTVRAVDGVSLDIFEGETLGIVGESGCGKSTLGRLLKGLIKPTEGDISYNAIDNKDIQVIFQNPYSSLNPRMKIKDIIGEPLIIHRLAKGKKILEKVEGLLKAVRLERKSLFLYPCSFSGGERQRIGIARALASNPRLIICDEPISSLDTHIQSRILTLLESLKQERGLTYLFISHNLKVVEQISDRVIVMYLGKIMEIASSKALYQKSLHPYTEALFSAAAGKKRIILRGEVPSSIEIPQGCRFHTRCPYAKKLCKEAVPLLEEKEKSHLAACHFPLI